jgi:hypothetical protein
MTLFIALTTAASKSSFMIFGDLKEHQLSHKVNKRWVSSQGAALFWGLLDLSRLWEFLDGIYEVELIAGWLTSIGYDGEVLAIPKDRLEN